MWILCLIVNSCASWLESPLDIGITEYSFRHDESINILSIEVIDLFLTLVGNVIILIKLTDNLRFQSELFKLFPHIYTEILHVLESAVLKHVAEKYVGTQVVRQ